MFPSDFQGTWNSLGSTHNEQGHPTQIVITSDRYTLTRDTQTETGRLEVMLMVDSADKTDKPKQTYRVRMTERLQDSTHLLDAVVEWTLNSTLTAFSTSEDEFNLEVTKRRRKTETERRRKTQSRPVSGYRLPPNRDPFKRGDL